jgi:hypothetical protein
MASPEEERLVKNSDARASCARMDDLSPLVSLALTTASSGTSASSGTAGDTADQGRTR